MKKLILTLLLLLLSYSLNAQVQKKDLTGEIGISLYGGANIPTNGDITSTVSTTDFIYSGPRFGLGVSYFFGKTVGIEASANYDLNFYKDDFKINGKRSAVSNLSVSIDGIYIPGCLLNKIPVLPFVRAGVGIYNWRHLDDAPCKGGEVISINGIEQKGSSFGFNVGIGADYPISKRLSVGLVLDYSIYFPKNEDKFGKEFAAQGSLTPQLKLSYYLPTH